MLLFVFQIRKPHKMVDNACQKGESPKYATLYKF